MPSPTRRQFVTALGAASIGAASLAHAASSSPGQDEKPKAGERKVPALQATLLLVRHTEKDTDDRVDPSLSDIGKVRANEFARVFGATGVTALVHTEYKRTRDTLAPLAELHGLKMETIGASEAPALIRRLSEAGPDEIIAVSGHSNTIPAIAWSFGIELPGLERPKGVPETAPGYLPHDAYDRVHVLTPGAKKARLTELRYGVPV